MKLVILESPYAGNVEHNEAYARLAMADMLSRDEAPFASHLLYTQDGVLDDTDPGERAKGIMAGHEWMRRADYVVAYTDHGYSSGMLEGIKRAETLGLEIQYRSLVGTVGFDQLERFGV